MTNQDVNAAISEFERYVDSKKSKLLSPHADRQQTLTALPRSAIFSRRLPQVVSAHSRTIPVHRRSVIRQIRALPLF